MGHPRGSELKGQDGNVIFLSEPLCRRNGLRRLARDLLRALEAERHSC